MIKKPKIYFIKSNYPLDEITPLSPFDDLHPILTNDPNLRFWLKF